MSLLLTGYNEEQAPLAELTVPRMAMFASRHGLTFRCEAFDAPKQEAYWRKITETLRAFEEGYGAVFWLDVDQMITNASELPGLGFGHAFHVSRDWGNDATGDFDFSMCGYIAVTDTAADAFKWVESKKAEFINGPFPEQTPMRQYFAMHPEKLRMQPRRVFNAVPEQIYPGAVPEPWHPGDFAAHLTHRSIPERIELFHHLKQIAGPI